MPIRPHKGVDHGLYKALIEHLTKNSIHVLLACVTVSNSAGKIFHVHPGFRQVAHVREAGFKFKHCVDVGYWQKPCDTVALSCRNNEYSPITITQ